MSRLVARSPGLSTGRPLRAGGRLTDGRTGRRLVALALLVAALLSLLALALPDDEPATRIDQIALAGPRSPGCVRLVVLVDQSGSMSDYAAARGAALQQLVAWAPANLEDTDELVVVNWAGSAQLALPVTPVSAFPRAQIAAVSLDEPDGTLLDGVLEVLAGLPATPCRTALVFLSDGVLTEPVTGDVDGVLRSAGVVSAATILPGSGDPPSSWHDLFPYGTVVDADARDPGRNAIAIARVLAEITGQRVERVG